jgi:hypothetical protein
MQMAGKRTWWVSLHEVDRDNKQGQYSTGLFHFR